jgi:glycosyltransferase involved in cell wall biosynthesis
MSNKLLSAFDSKTEKRISFILATKQRAKFLDKTLERVKLLKGKNDEVIVIDGNSTDDTPNILKKYSKIIDKAISEPDESEGHAFNKGILISSGKYIKLITDDDVLFADAIERSVEILENTQDADVLLCGGTKVVGSKEYVIYLPKGINYGRKVQDVFKYGGCGIGLFIRKRIFAKVGLLNIHAFALDIDFLTQCISLKANVRFCRLHMYIHPVHAHSGTIKQEKRWKEDVRRIKERYGLEHNNVLLQKISDLYSVKEKVGTLIFRNQTSSNSKKGPNLAKDPTFFNLKKISVSEYKKYKWDGGFS